MKNLTFTEDALTKIFREIGPRPEFITKQNLQERVPFVKRNLEKFAAALHTDFQKEGIEVENRTLTVKPAADNKLAVLSHLVVVVSKGSAVFFLEFTFIHGSDAFRAIATLSRAHAGKYDALMNVMSNNGPTFRSNFTKFFEAIDQKGFNIQKGS